MGSRKVQSRKAHGQVVSRATAIASKGIETATDFARFSSALMTDLMEGSVTPVVANAACRAGQNLLKVVELRLRYGEGESVATRRLVLCEGPGVKT